MGLVVVFTVVLFFLLARAFNKLNALAGARRARRKNKTTVNTTTKPTPNLVDFKKPMVRHTDLQKSVTPYKL